MESDDELMPKELELQHQNDILKHKLNSTEHKLNSAEHKLNSAEHKLNAANETIVAHGLTISLLQEKIQLLTLRQFSSKSEHHLLQQNLFDELDVADNDSEAKVDNDTLEITYTRKRKPNRKPLPAGLERVDTVVDINEADKRCACGCQKVQMGQKISEKLDIIPAKVQVLRTLRPQYVCNACDGDAISIAPLPITLLPKCLLSEGALAHVLVAKYVDHMPLYRQSRYWLRQGH